MLSHRVPFPPNKGEKIRTYHQIRYLLEQGHRVTVAAPFASVEEIPHYNALAQTHDILCYASPLGHRWLRLAKGLFTHQPLSVTNFHASSLQRQVDQLLAREHFDAVLCTASSMAEYVFRSRAGRVSGTRFVMDFMDLDSDKWRQYAVSARLPMQWVYEREARLLSAYESRIVDRFDASFFISEAEVELFRSQSNAKGEVVAIENGIDMQYFTPIERTMDSSKPTFLFTGVMDYKPNVDAVIWFVEEVWPKVLKTWPGATFYIAGMNPVAAVQALGSVPGVEVTGFVEDIRNYYARADLFVAPLRIARGVQNKVLQAMACGIPVVATSMGAEGIKCAPGKHLMVADDAAQFYQHIENLITNETLRRQLSENGVRLMQEQYSWESRLKPLEALLAGSGISTGQEQA